MLPAELAPIERVPRLPAHPNGIGWHRMARRWWADVWSSPMHYEYVRGDLPALFRLVVLVDEFWRSGSLKVASEIRMLEREFGLTPLSRRRLEWSIAQTEEAIDIREHNRSKRGIIMDGADVREVLEG
jgi:hypothetical protein